MKEGSRLTLKNMQMMDYLKVLRWEKEINLWQLNHGKVLQIIQFQLIIRPNPRDGEAPDASLSAQNTYLWVQVSRYQK